MHCTAYLLPDHHSWYVAAKLTLLILQGQEQLLLRLQSCTFNILKPSKYSQLQKRHLGSVPRGCGMQGCTRQGPATATLT